MTILFNKALVRRTSYNIIKAISSKNLHTSYEEINLEHNQYISALKNSDLNVTILDPLNDFPDSIFVEDPGLTYKNNYISLRPAENSRFGESKIMAKDVNELFDNIYFVNNGYIEGGDILRINDHFIVGISSRTNTAGAENLSNILNDLGATAEISITPKNILHLKSECSLIDEETILMSQNMMEKNIFNKKYKFLVIPEGEEIASNTIRINNNLLIPSNCPKTEKMLSKNYNLISLKVDEVFKLDAGLSCMSLRW